MSLEESLEGVILCSMNLLPKKIASMMLMFALVLRLFDSNTLARNKLMALLSSGSFSHPWFSHFGWNTGQYLSDSSHPFSRTQFREWRISVRIEGVD